MPDERGAVGSTDRATTRPGPLRQTPGRRLILLAGATALLALALATPTTAIADPTITVSPLPGTPDASAETQVSFLGIPASDITSVSVVGSRSGKHTGRLAAYSSRPGASFLPAHPFVGGEQVKVSAVISSTYWSRRVTTHFTVARHPVYHFGPTASPARTKPGTAQSFVSEPHIRPTKVQLTTHSTQQAPGDIFFAFDSGYAQWGPTIVDQSGNLVWFKPAPKGQVAMDFLVEQYEGKPALVWWQGYIAKLGVGFGVDEVFDSSYRHVAQIRAGNGYWADLHDAQITPQGSALITAYTLVDANLSGAHGPSNGVLLDGLLQEVDIKTGLVMFEWHAWGHVPLKESFSTPSSARPWDFFHINSIATIPSGNLLISARNTWAAYDVSAKTGRVLWRLGGRHSSFKMGSGTGTAWQHDARWQPDGTITLFDDGAVPKEHSQSRVIRERIDWKHRSVRLVSRYVHRPALLSGSQGNYQTLPDGDSFVGWGAEPYLTEFAPNGKIVWDARLPRPGASYRAYKFPWSATPAYPPSIAVRPSKAGGETVYASWNGATTVASWRVLTGTSVSSLAPVATAAKKGFETAMPLSASAAQFAVQALDAAGNVLAVSPTVAR
jgi:arylsulfotransferase ASST